MTKRIDSCFIDIISLTALAKTFSSGLYVIDSLTILLRLWQNQFVLPTMWQLETNTSALIVIFMNTFITMTSNLCVILTRNHIVRVCQMM